MGKRVRAALIALVLAGAVIVWSGGGIMSAVCAGLGSNHPLYVIFGCPLIVDQPSPEG